MLFATKASIISSYNKQGMDLMDEQRLIAGCKRGEQWARRDVYEKYAPAMFSLCVRYVGDTEAAKDVLQDGFVKIFTKADQFAEKGNFGGWIRSVFINTSLEYLRRRNYQKEDIKVDDLENEQESISNLPENISADDLMECIAELPEKYRTVFNLYAIEGYSHNEIAMMTGIQESSSRSQFLRARQLLQKKVLELMKKEYAGK